MLWVFGRHPCINPFLMSALWTGLGVPESNGGGTTPSISGIAPDDLIGFWWIHYVVPSLDGRMHFMADLAARLCCMSSIKP